MIRHRYGIDPATGKPGQYKIDCGRAVVPFLKGSRIVPPSAKHGSDNHGRRVHGSGAA